jgi:hypothetical protein
MRASVAIYRCLLWLYPAAFRRAYGAQMAQVFRDSCRQAQQERGLPGVIVLWLATLVDLLRSALAEHLSEGPIMSRPFYIRMSGLLTLVGAAIELLLNIDESTYGFIPGYTGIAQHLAQVSSGLLIGIALVPIICWTLGLVGMLLAQRGWVGRVSASLALLALGAELAVEIIAYLHIAPLVTILESSFGWLAVLGLGFLQANGLILGVALIVCGVVTLKAHLLPRWNAVPLLLGLLLVFYNLTIYYWATASPMIGIGSASVALVPFLAWICIFCLWGCLGYALWAKRRPKQAAPAVQAQPSAG